MNGWQKILVLAVLAGSGVQAAPLAAAAPGRSSADSAGDVRVEGQELIPAGHVERAQPSATPSRMAANPHPAAPSASGADSGQDGYAPGSEPSFPGLR